MRRFPKKISLNVQAELQDTDKLWERTQDRVKTVSNIRRKEVID